MEPLSRLSSNLQLFVPERHPGWEQPRVRAAAVSQDGGSHANIHNLLPAGEGTVSTEASQQPVTGTTNCICFSLQYKVYAVPAGEFSMDYVEPKVLCVSTHGRFSEDRCLEAHVLFIKVTERIT